MGKLIADIGGTLGLILGLNILEILVFAVKATKLAQEKLFLKENKLANTKLNSFGVQALFGNFVKFPSTGSLKSRFLHIQITVGGGYNFSE